MRKTAAAFASAAMATTAVVALGAAPASAHPICNGGYFYSVSGSGTTWEPTNVSSDWADPGVTITYNKTSTSTWTATFSVSVGADAGVIFAKVDTTIGASVAKSWTESNSWSYSATVKGNTMGRLMLFHEAAYANVTKTVQYTNCATAKVYTTRVVAPLSSNVNKWGIQYN
ncbi:hypothetical protein P3T36_000227 [Kitasatospora sp. MAP12-15]|uniref:hypothetical protein n=1 Tax=unclassified Kitasatospora TaxID=2633591 RepID=UPI002475F8FF|nr:hypothetical protein [Kitasatospora sp. MAP12-44]MDH6109456.1 hypothetical protein [Kitasatospora sp. MAP12-44]